MTAPFVTAQRGTAPLKCGYDARPLELLLVVFLGSLLVSAIVSPLLFQLVVWAKGAVPEAVPGFLARRADPGDFPRYFDRLRWLPVLLAIPWLMRDQALLSWRALGFDGGFRKALIAFAAGVAMFAPVIGVQHWASDGGLEWVPGASGGRFLSALMGGIAAGVAIGLLEETVFRGLILRLWLRAIPRTAAIGLSAAFFAIVHFKKVPWPDEQAVTLLSGIEVAWRTLFAAVYTFEPAKFVNLLLAGLLLNLLFLRTGTLWACIGLHAGWVALRAVYRETVTAAPTGAPEWLLGTETLIDGLLPAAMMLPPIVWLWWPRKS